MLLKQWILQLKPEVFFLVVNIPVYLDIDGFHSLFYDINKNMIIITTVYP